MQVYLHKYEGNLNTNTYQNVKKIVTELNIPFIDLNIELFNKKKDPLTLHPFKDVSSHFTPDGYKEVAEIIYSKTNN